MCVRARVWLCLGLVLVRAGLRLGCGYATGCRGTGRAVLTAGACLGGLGCAAVCICVLMCYDPWTTEPSGRHLAAVAFMHM